MSAWIAGFSAANFRISRWVIEATNKIPVRQKTQTDGAARHVGGDRNLAVQIGADDLSRAPRRIPIGHPDAI
jgi:hypothetical protein